MKIKESGGKSQKKMRKVITKGHLKQRNPVEDKLIGMNKPTVGLSNISRTEGQASNRCRICVRNLPSNMKNADIFLLFKDFGPIKEILIKQEPRMLIITLSNRPSAERAVSCLNGMKYENNVLVVCPVPIPAIKVINLTKHVTNELLFLAFSIFGKIEECYVIINKCGNTTGEGVVEYESKQAMYTALRFCRENSYFVTASNIPVIAEQYDPIRQYDGKPESLVSLQSLINTQFV